MLLIWGCVAAALGVTAIILHLGEIRARPSLLFTQPPLPGVLLLVTLGTSALIRMLAPGRQIGLRRLRVIEWIGVALAAGFFGFNQTLSLYLGTAWDIRENSMDLAAGLGAPWGALAVGYGVLIPSSARHCAVRTVVLAACAFIPELLTFPGTIGLSAGAPVYLAIKVVTVGAMSALAIYGAYRIDVLRQDVQEARQLGQYVLRRILGQGGMGEVHLAEHQFLRRACAVKLIRPEQAGNEETLARFEREVRAAARLTHPNTIQIYDYGRAEDGTFYYAMEYLPGISLQELVEDHGPLPPARAVHVLSQLCGALHAVGHDRRYAGLHVTRAVRWRCRGHRSERHLQPRRCRLFSAHRQRTLCRALGDPDDGGPPVRDAQAIDGAAGRRPSDSQQRDRQVPRQVARGAVSRHGDARTGPARFGTR